MSIVKTIGFWVHGLVGATISGGAAALAAAYVDPETFNFAEGLREMGQLFIVSGIIGAVSYLKQSPLPPISKDVDL